MQPQLHHHDLFFLLSDLLFIHVNTLIEVKL